MLHCEKQIKRICKLALFSLIVCVWSSITWLWISNTSNGPTGNMEKPACTFGVLREYYKKNHFYPGGGTWKLSGYSHNRRKENWNKYTLNWQGIDERWTTSAMHPRFILDTCSLKDGLFPNVALAKCLIKANVSSVMTFGDSNGRRYNNGHSGSYKSLT